MKLCQHAACTESAATYASLLACSHRFGAAGTQAAITRNDSGFCPNQPVQVQDLQRCQAADCIQHIDSQALNTAVGAAGCVICCCHTS